MIELQEISVAFLSRHKAGPAVHAVREASLRVERGEVFGIVGSSGAGKSTLVRTINLLERPDTGRVIVGGVDLTRLGDRELRRERQKIGMIFQHFNLMHTRTVWDNTAFALKVAGRSRAEIRQRVPELLALVGLSDKAKAYPDQLSGGQKQRVGIARALANHPELLLCDEPTSALDLETAAGVLALLKQINQQLGLTIVIISHEMAVIKAVCDRVAVMDAGHIVEQGTVYDIFARPSHPFTRELVDRTFNLDLPERHLNAIHGTLLKVLFLGEKAETPVLFEAAWRHGVAVNILHGKIEYIGDRAIGLLVVSLTGAPGPVGEAVAFIRDNTERVEVLHG
ncbi:MAG: ATP-binding cassette domain-containing protein [Holophaga sp.]|nr:ATP-binding cassette domain-containing protein [Holophaga sp.]